MKKWNIDELREKGFKNGSIIRVKMHNFLTFDSVEVFPGPHLNILLGPNGTGKSSITHAICLACGGNPKSLGRSDNLAQFVKHGKENEDAFCEVDVLCEIGTKSVRRTISSENRASKWTINGSTTTQKSVLELMSSLSIDVDNLCSFMAQDKVGEFTRQSPQGILQMTLQSIKNEDNNEEKSQTLYDEQIILNDVEGAKIQKERLVREKEDVVTALQKELDGMRVEVERSRRREELNELMHLYE
eukprot:gene5767-11657_t